MPWGCGLPTPGGWSSPRPGPASSPAASRRDLRRQPIAPRLSDFDRLNLILEPNVLDRLFEREIRQPPTMPPAPYDACEKKAGRVSSL